MSQPISELPTQGITDTDPRERTVFSEKLNVAFINNWDVNRLTVICNTLQKQPPHSVPGLYDIAERFMNFDLSRLSHAREDLFETLRIECTPEREVRIEKLSSTVADTIGRLVYLSQLELMMIARRERNSNFLYLDTLIDAIPSFYHTVEVKSVSNQQPQDEDIDSVRLRDYRNRQINTLKYGAPDNVYLRKGWLKKFKGKQSFDGLPLNF